MSAWTGHIDGAITAAESDGSDAGRRFHGRFYQLRIEIQSWPVRVGTMYFDRKNIRAVAQQSWIYRKGKPRARLVGVGSCGVIVVRYACGQVVPKYFRAVQINRYTV